MTFNVRYDEEWDGENCWQNRRAHAIDTVRRHAPDLVGLQEPTPQQREEIAAGLRDLAPRDDVLFRPTRFELRERGAIALSSDGQRTCAWARMLDRTAQRDLLFANAHFDTAEAAWLPSAQTTARCLMDVADAAAVVLVGDFNCAAGCSAHQYLLDAGFRDAWYETSHQDAGVVTYHGFTGLENLPTGAKLDRFLEETSPAGGEFAHYQAHVRQYGNYRIDWILVRGALSCVTALIDAGKPARRSSDHYPVVASIAWQ